MTDNKSEHIAEFERIFRSIKKDTQFYVNRVWKEGHDITIDDYDKMQTVLTYMFDHAIEALSNYQNEQETIQKELEFHYSELEKKLLEKDEVIKRCNQSLSEVAADLSKDTIREELISLKESVANRKRIGTEIRQELINQGFKRTGKMIKLIDRIID